MKCHYVCTDQNRNRIPGGPAALQLRVLVVDDSEQITSLLGTSACSYRTKQRQIKPLNRTGKVTLVEMKQNDGDGINTGLGNLFASISFLSKFLR